jgi:ubiquinone/menaquinone biosynthesis C-methylase UbiE
MLHVAPEGCLRRKFKAIRSIRYFTADLSPVAMTQLDLTRIAFPENTFDVVFASHVLEHIEDDRAAMQEVFRILKKGGWAILQVPILKETTYEDPDITSPEGRLEAFGQQDHVRAYGFDYYQRLEDAGFQVSRERLPIQADQKQVRKLSIIANQEICFCSKP